MTAIADTSELVRMIGTKVRTTRRRQGLTLKDISLQTGLSPSMLSMLERGVANASVGTLVSVAAALGVHMAELFEAQAHTRDDEHPVLRLVDQTVVAGEHGARRRILVFEPDSGLELVVNEYDQRGDASGDGAVHHRGREVGLLLSGSLVVELEGVTHALEPGDSIAYDSNRPHRIVNSGVTPARAVWINLDGE